MSGSFGGFATTAEAVAATSKRLQKAALLGAYLGTLSDADLRVAARFFSGQAFALHDQRTTRVGGASLLSAIEAASGADPQELRARLVQLGDMGDAAGPYFRGTSDSLSLQDVQQALSDLADTGSARHKTERVTRLLAGTDALQARYLIKLLAGDLRIGLKEGAVEDALARAWQATTEQVQWANMLCGDIGETAVLARHQQLQSVRLRRFHPLKFMLATAAASPDEVARQMPAEFVVEDKYDGIRAQAHVGDGRAALFSRTLDDISSSFPELTLALSALGRNAILDGEIVPVSGMRILPFQELQTRLGRKKMTAQMVDVAFIAYDILMLDDECVMLDAPFSQRRIALESLPLDGQKLRLAPSRRFQGTSQLDQEFAEARLRGNEGLMVKDPQSKYKPGRRGRDWLKIKRALATLDVVVTAVEVGHGRRHHLLSDYTFAVRASVTDATLLNVGKAYSGLTDAELADMSEWFKQHTLQEFWHGKVRLVEPRVVIEIAFDRVQPSKRHKSGFALRFPRILRLRPDKPVSDIDTLDTVRRLASQ